MVILKKVREDFAGTVMNKFFSNIINIILGISCILWFYGLAFIFFAESLYRITLEIEIHSDEKGVKQFTEFDSVILEDEIADRLRGRQFAFDTLKKLSPRYGAKYSQEDSNEILEKIFNRLEYVPERFPKKNKEKSFPTLIYYSYLNINTSEPEFSKRIFNIFGDLLSNEMKNINESMIFHI